MKVSFKKVGDALMSFFYAILLILASPVVLIWLVFATIHDYIKYKKTRYYKDTHERYSWLCAQSYYVSFYDSIKSAGLPIDYYRDRTIKLTGYGYFIFNDVLILCDYDSDILYFDKDNNEWMVYDEHDYVLLEPTTIDEELKKVNEFLDENRCKKVIIFVERELLEEATGKEYERIILLPIEDGDKISALKTILE